jgi:rare lipoprotein A
MTAANHAQSGFAARCLAAVTAVTALILISACSPAVVQSPKQGVYVPQIEQTAPPPRTSYEPVKIPGEGAGTLERYITASWYGPQFHGKQTSSGEIYNMYSYTAAHKTLPFGTKLRVTNTENGRSTQVLVNDRGPFVEGRDLDLSFQSAKEIGMVEKGVAAVEIEYLGRDDAYKKYINISGAVASSYTVQVASFRQYDNATRMKKGLEFHYKGVFIQEAVISGLTYYRVRVGKYGDKEPAVQTAQALADEGYNTLVTGNE